jgi:hypothetical protein
LIAAYRIRVAAGSLGSYSPDIFGESNVGMLILLGLVFLATVIIIETQLVRLARGLGMEQTPLNASEFLAMW